MGIQSTPHASMFIRSLLDKRPPSAKNLDHVLVNYDVPLKGGTKLGVKAVNWPKGYYIDGLRPPGAGLTRALVAGALTDKPIPKGTESKYSNTLDFFDYVEKEQRLEEGFRAGGAVTGWSAPPFKP